MSSNNFVPYQNNGMNDTAWTKKPVSEGFTDSVSNAINNTNFFADTFNVATGRKIKLNDSVEITFPPFACSNFNDNTAITNGTIKVEVLLLKRKGDFIKYLIPTTSKSNLLESGGSFFVRISKNGQELSMLPNAYFKLRWNDAAPKTDMKFFTGIPLMNHDSLFTWMPATNGYVTLWDSTGMGVAKKGYDITSGTTHWINSDFFIDTLTGTRTRLNVTLPLNNTNKNTMVFAVLKNKRTIVRLSADYQTRSFYSLNIPVNSVVTLLTISMIENNFYVDSRDVTVLNADRFALFPVKKSITEINTILDNL